MVSSTVFTFLSLLFLGATVYAQSECPATQAFARFYLQGPNNTYVAIRSWYKERFAFYLSDSIQDAGTFAMVGTNLYSYDLRGIVDSSNLKTSGYGGPCDDREAALDYISSALP